MTRLTASLLWVLCWAIGAAALAETGAQALLVLSDATFTDSVTDREPGERLTTFSLAGEEPARLWFWFRVECQAACLPEPGVVPEVPIYVKWAVREGDTFVVKDTIPLTVRGLRWRAWTYKEHLQSGSWRVAVFTDEGPVCLEDQCQFTIEVAP